ncbi:hypothetical protein [Priestia aryabhattai]
MNRKTGLYIKLLKTKNKNGSYNATISFSTDLYDWIIKNEMNAMRFGHSEDKKYFFVQFNRELNGLSLVHSNSLYYKTKTGKKSDSILKQIQELSANKLGRTNKIFLVSENLFLIENISAPFYTNSFINKDNIIWFNHSLEKLSIRFHQETQDFFIKQVLYFSSDFLEYVKKKNHTHLDIGYILNGNFVVLKFNSDKKGLPLIKQSGEYYKVLGATKLYRHLKNKGVNIQLETSYTLKEINDMELIASFSETPEHKINRNEICWISQEKEFKPVPKAALKYSLTFYTIYKSSCGKRTYALRFSKAFCDLLKKLKPSYIDIKLTTDKKSILVNLNNSQNGICLIKDDGELKLSPAKGVNDLFYSLGYIEGDKGYSLEKVDDFNYKIDLCN